MSPDQHFAALISRLQHGDEEAAQFIVERFAQRLVQLTATRLPRVLNPKVDPEDLVQSVFRCFFHHQAGNWLTLETWDNLWTLLTVLTVRKCGHCVSHFQAARRDVRREVCPTESDSRWQALAPDPSPAEAILLAETLDGLLAGLKPDQRAIVRFRLEGYSILEISQKAHCTERTVHRVLKKVRARLEKRCFPRDSL